MTWTGGALPGSEWHKSSYSGSQTECVEVARDSAVIGVRDTKQRDGGALAVPSPAWHALTGRMG